MKYKISNLKSQIYNNEYITRNNKYEYGSALVSVLFIAMISITVSTAAIIMLSASILASSQNQLGEEAYSLAESGAENAILRLLRDPSYTGHTGYTGETLTLGDGTATVTVSGSSPYTIQSVGKVGNFSRTVQVQVGYNAQQVLSVISWQEITP